MENEIKEKEFQVIVKPSIARRLLKNHPIIDIKPNKLNKEASVFVFRNDEQFKHDLLEVIKKK